MFPRNYVYDVPNRDRLHIFENSVSSLSLLEKQGNLRQFAQVC